MANLLLAQARRETFIEIQPDTDEADELGDKYYEGRFMAARSLLKPNDLRPAYKMFSDQFNAWSNCVMKYYEVSETFNLSIYCSIEGYKMDIHTDVGDRSIFDVIVYLGNDFDTSEDGGVLEIFKVPIGGNEETESVLIEQIIPKHGTIVVLNNLNPTLFHRVTEVTKKGAKRFQIIANFGMIDPPTWNVEFNDVGGFALPGEIFKFGEITRLKNALDKLT